VNWEWNTKDSDKRPQSCCSSKKKQIQIRISKIKKTLLNFKKSNFRDSDFEFEGIIESEGVLEMMADGYGFLRFRL
jgi:transcription termination factor Rho